MNFTIKKLTELPVSGPGRIAVSAPARQEFVVRTIQSPTAFHFDQKGCFFFGQMCIMQKSPSTIRFYYSKPKCHITYFIKVNLAQQHGVKNKLEMMSVC